jgi:hypothetical protein
MKLRIEAATSVEQKAAAAGVRRAVFHTECVRELCQFVPGRMSRRNELVARFVSDDRVIATLTVVETTGQDALHEKNGLSFGESDRVARYTQMAVLGPYRGLNLPLYLLLEARRLYISAGGFSHTWLLMPASRAATSKLCTMLDFSASSRSVVGDQGLCRVLARDEMTRAASLADTRTMSFLEDVRPGDLDVIPVSESAHCQLVREDEWVAQ